MYHPLAFDDDMKIYGGFEEIIDRGRRLSALISILPAICWSTIRMSISISAGITGGHSVPASRSISWTSCPSSMSLKTGVYDLAEDSWKWELIGRGQDFKWSNVICYEDYAYFNLDYSPDGGVMQ